MNCRSDKKVNKNLQNFIIMSKIISSLGEWIIACGNAEVVFTPIMEYQILPVWLGLADGVGGTKSALELSRWDIFFWYLISWFKVNFVWSQIFEFFIL